MVEQPNKTLITVEELQVRYDGWFAKMHPTIGAIMESVPQKYVFLSVFGGGYKSGYADGLRAAGAKSLQETLVNLRAKVRHELADPYGGIVGLELEAMLSAIDAALAKDGGSK